MNMFTTNSWILNQSNFLPSNLYFTFWKISFKFLNLYSGIHVMVGMWYALSTYAWHVDFWHLICIKELNNNSIDIYVVWSWKSWFETSFLVMTCVRCEDGHDATPFLGTWHFPLLWKHENEPWGQKSSCTSVWTMFAKHVKFSKEDN